jgi:Flp pilus assembly protein TadD
VSRYGKKFRVNSKRQRAESSVEGPFCLQVEQSQPFSQHDAVLNCLFAVNLFNFVPNADVGRPKKLPPMKLTEIHVCLRISVFGVLISSSLLQSVSAQIQGELLDKEGAVEFSQQFTNWAPAAIGLGLNVQDRLRTLSLSRATVRLAELDRVRMDELTTLEILPPKETTSKATLDLRAGAIYFFTRDKPREFLIQTPHAIGASRGTEFLVQVQPGQTLLTVFDGEVSLANPQGSLILTNGEQGSVLPGQAPVKTAVIQATNIVQWWLYYPAVLDLQEIPFTPAEAAALGPSTTAYRSGNLRSALEAYPAGRTPQSDPERVYYAGLLLSVGQVDKADALITTVRIPLANALREVIAAVAKQPLPDLPRPILASEWLARSYYLQRTSLKDALEAARRATEKSPSFGFSWARVAELEFSFGRHRESADALERALDLSPKNAEALALRGFVLSAQNKTAAALNSFQQAIEADGALGNGWLGRGLCRIRQGDFSEGRRDLQTAAALEPNRSFLRSYLGKAFGQEYDTLHARRELSLARRLDQNDPTPWLYESWLNYQQNQPNAAVSDLETSKALNDNRAVYRSRFLLDQDRAVASSSLARIYQDAGLNQVSVNEATRAVTYDYADYSAHLFLADSFYALRDPSLFNLRYETAWFNELLLANALAPAGTRTISQNISQQEYTRMFERDGLGFDTFSQYRSDGQFWEITSQYGTFGRTSYSLDLDYSHNEGYRPNDDLSRIEWFTQIKQQLSPQDTVLLLTKYEDFQSGDNRQLYDKNSADPRFRFDEYQAPQLVGLYHREWAPGIHTLVLVDRLVNEQTFSDHHSAFQGPAFHVLETNSLNPTTYELEVNQRFNSSMLENKFEMYGTEVNQIFQSEKQILLAGGRFQTGNFDAKDRIDTPLATNGLPDPFLAALFTNPPAHIDEDFGRYSVYGYYTLKPVPELLLTAGISYDHLEFPDNFRFSPINAGSTTRNLLAPKGAIVWSPGPAMTVRGAYSEGLGGVTFDDAYRLEPTQLGGFNQTFRSIIPESEVGSLAGAKYQTYGAALEFKLPTRTYLTLQAQYLKADSDEDIGVFYDAGGALPPPPQISPGTLREELRYREITFWGSLNQLIARDWSVGLDYRYTDSKLRWNYPTIPTNTPGLAPLNRTERGKLHQTDAFVQFTHPSGFFGRAEALWFLQDNSGYTPARPGKDFVQVNLLAGYRFWHRRAELTFGILNVGGDDYHLNPLNFYSELPHGRVFMGRVRLSF